jgi:type II secretion system protein C
MNLVIKQSTISLFLKVVVLIIVVKACWVIASFFLPKQGIDKIAIETTSFYDKYRFAKAFGLKNDVPNIAGAEQGPIYKLDSMKLRGIYVSKEQAFVAIQDGTSIEIISRNEVYKGYTLAEVFPLKAIFTKEGARYEVSLEEEVAKKPVLADVSGDDVVRFIAKPQIKKHTQDMSTIWKNISIQEIVEKGKLEGFKVTKIEPTSIFGKLGLQVGDIIIGANNKRFVTYSDVLKLYQEIDKIGNLKLTFIRDKQEKELEYEIY